MTKVTTNKPNGIVLDPATYANVVQIYAGVTVTNSGNANAIGQAGATYTFDIQNAGTIQAPDVGAGISLTNGGTVTNLAAGVVAGGAFGGVDIDGAAGTVTNSGTISAASTSRRAGW